MNLTKLIDEKLSSLDINHYQLQNAARTTLAVICAILLFVWLGGTVQGIWLIIATWFLSQVNLDVDRKTKCKLIIYSGLFAAIGATIATLINQHIYVVLVFVFVVVFGFFIFRLHNPYFTRIRFWILMLILVAAGMPTSGSISDALQRGLFILLATIIVLVFALVFWPQNLLAQQRKNLAAVTNNLRILYASINIPLKDQPNLLYRQYNLRSKTVSSLLEARQAQESLANNVHNAEITVTYLALCNTMTRLFELILSFHRMTKKPAVRAFRETHNDEVNAISRIYNRTFHAISERLTDQHALIHVFTIKHSVLEFAESILTYIEQIQSQLTAIDIVELSRYHSITISFNKEIVRVIRHMQRLQRLKI